MISTVDLGFGQYMNITMEVKKPPPKKPKNFFVDSRFWRSDMIVKIALGRKTVDFSDLLNTTLKQRELLQDVVGKSMTCIKRVKQSTTIKGIILPLAKIGKLLSSYNTNIKKLKHYEKKIARCKRRFRAVAIVSLAIFAVLCFINIIIGAVYLIINGYNPTFRDVYIEYVDRIITTDLGSPKDVNRQNKSFVAEETITILHELPDTERSSVVFDQMYTLNVALRYFANSLVAIVWAILVALWVTDIINTRYVFAKLITIPASEKELSLYNKFFDVLHEKKEDSRRDILHMIKGKATSTTLNDVKEFLTDVMKNSGIAHPDKHAIYGKELFMNNIQLRRLIMRLKLWTKQEKKPTEVDLTGFEKFFKTKIK